MEGQPMQSNEQRELSAQSEPSYPFLSGVADIRRRARRHIQDGAVTTSYGADRDTVLRLLNEALATELVCVVRYKRHSHIAGEMVAETIRDELLQHANEEQVHADRIAERIVELGGAPNLNPDGLGERSHSESSEGEDLAEMLAEDLIAERIAIESYREIIQYLGNKDETTRQLFESILAVEEEDAQELRSLREDMLRRERVASGADSIVAEIHRDSDLQ
jgi:bacterioferritin